VSPPRFRINLIVRVRSDAEPRASLAAPVREPSLYGRTGVPGLEAENILTSRKPHSSQTPTNFRWRFLSLATAAYTDKAANFTGDNVKAIADIGNLQNIDLKVSPPALIRSRWRVTDPETLPLCVASRLEKRHPHWLDPPPLPAFSSPQFAKGGVDLAGQTCDITVARDSSGASGVEIKSNVDKVGDVTVSLVQEGHKTLNNEDEAAAANAVRISADIPLSDVNADLTGSVDYDLVGKDANIRIGYHKDDITVRLRTNVDSDKKAKTTINLDYSGIEGIGVGVEVKDDKTGALTVTKDDFKLKVPVKDNKPNAEEASITYNWGIDM
jgi:hypothetical protein